MKNILITLTLSLLAINAFSQTTVTTPELRYSVRGNMHDRINKKELITANTILDFQTGYPISWIKNYVYMDISVTSNDKTKTYRGKNDTLSAEQKGILKNVKFGDKVVISSEYKYKNVVTEELESSRLLIQLSVVPEVEAECLGGFKQLETYLKENNIDKIQQSESKLLKAATVLFIVNEEGEATNAKISRSSGDPKIDQLLLNAINKMPKWKPAQDSKGIKVKQDFVFQLGLGKQGC